MSVEAHENQLVIAAFARLRPVALGIAVGIPTALLLFGATVVLLLAAAGQPAGTPVGPHLGLLRHFLPGYSVSWTGSVVALGYGFLVGFALGTVLAWLVNASHTLYVHLLERRMRRRVIQEGL
jgi:hypothetical protein